jgi:hypothetical protein
MEEEYLATKSQDDTPEQSKTQSQEEEEIFRAA